jgi:hypothetical protein
VTVARDAADFRRIVDELFPVEGAPGQVDTGELDGEICEPDCAE